MHQSYPGAIEGSSRNPALGMHRDGIPEYHMDHPVGPDKSVHIFKNRFATEGARKKEAYCVMFFLVLPARIGA